MQSTAEWISENRFEMRTPNGAFFVGPKPGGAEDPSPVEYLAASLAGCVGHFVAKFLSRRGFEPKGLKISVAGTMAENPHRIGSFDIVVDLPKGITPELQEIARRAAETCTVHHTLLHPPKMTFTYNLPA